MSIGETDGHGRKNLSVFYQPPAISFVCTEKSSFTIIEKVGETDCNIDSGEKERHGTQACLN